MRLLSPFSLLFLLITLTAVHADDWTKWRGPNANGISQETGWNALALKHPDILWKAEVGRGHSAVAVKGQRLYTMGEAVTRTASDTIYYDAVLCLHSRTGKEIWRFQYESPLETWPGPSATPVLNGNRLYTMGREGDVHCLNASTGKVIWHHNLLTEGLSEKPNWGFSASVLIHDGMAVVNAGQSGVALDKATGDVVWKSAPEKCGLATPVLWHRDGRDQIVINGNEIITGVDAKTGRPLWSQSWFSYTDPQFFGNRFFNPTSESGLGYFQVNGATVDTVWQKKRLRGYTWNNFIIIDGYAYGFCMVRRKFHLHCIHLETGEVKWSVPMPHWGALMGAGDKLILIDGVGHLSVLNASPEGHEILSETTLWDLGDWQKYPRGEPNVCWTNPVLANGRLYVRNTFGALVCLNMK